MIKPLSLEALTHLLSGAMDDAAVWIARNENEQQALAEAQQALEALLEGIKI